MLLRVYNGADWKTTLMDVVPQRKGAIALPFATDLNVAVDDDQKKKTTTNQEPVQEVVVSSPPIVTIVTSPPANATTEPVDQANDNDTCNCSPTKAVDNDKMEV